MKPLLALLGIATLSIGTVACGGADSAAPRVSTESATAASVAASTSSVTAKRDRDNDEDSNGDSRYDADDNWGHTASPADREAITTVIRRYYAAAALANGKAACTLVYAVLAETVPEDYAQVEGASTIHDRSCAAVMTGVFKQRRRQLADDIAALHVTRVRVNGDRGWAFLSFGPPLERRMLLHKEQGAWKIDALLDIEMP